MDAVTRRNVMLLAWTGPVGIVTVLLGWFVFAGFLPPPSPDLSPAEVTELWSEDTNLKRLGMVLCVWGGVLYITFTMALTFVLRRRERILSSTQAALGVFGTVFFSLNFLVLAVVAYRPDRPSETTQLLHDLGFTMTFSPVAPFTFQYVVIGLAILQDHSARPVFPRWVGYVNLWVAVLFIPACAIPFFKTGPLAWNGLLSFWVPVAVFIAWYVVMFWGVRAALAAEEQDSAASEPLADLRVG